MEGTKMGSPVKVIIWASPRTCSTALLKCLSGIPNAKIFDELYTVAFLFGPDRLDQSPTGEKPQAIQSGQGKGYAFPSSICTYEWIKETLQQDQPSEQLVITKEIVYCLNQKYDCLPQGYRHVFLLRHPIKVIPSWKKLTFEMVKKFGNEVPATLDEFVFDKLPPHVVPPGMSFKEGYDLYQYIKEKKMDVDPVIVDADDLVQNPKAVISAICTKLGIPYSESFLTWDKGTDVVDTWTVGTVLKNIILHAEAFENFRNSTNFHQPIELEKQAATRPVEATVTPDIERCISFSMPFYQQMYEQRLQVSKV